MTALINVLRRLGRENFPGSRFTKAREGRTIAEDALGRFGSAFQPIVDADGGAVIGHHAFLRAADGGGNAMAPSQLFASVRDEASVERLDWLARALHMVNYFAFNERTRLFVPVDARIIAASADEHRACFDALLTSLDVPTSRVVVALPECALDDPVTFVRSTLSYRIRGYRVLCTLRPADAHADLDHVFMADPDYVGIAVSGATTAARGGACERLRKVVQPLHARGIRAVARQVETGDEAMLARDAGFAFLQGRYVAPPAPEAPLAGTNRSPRRALAAS